MSWTRTDESIKEGYFENAGRDVYIAQLDVEHWRLHRPVVHTLTGERKSETVATIVEIADEKIYRITYPIPKVHPTSKGFRTYTHQGDLASAIARVRRAANR